MDVKRLFQMHAKSLQSELFRRTRDPQLAADLTQESFARLVELHRDQMPGNPAAYLYRIAHNLLIDHVRQQTRRKTDLATHEELGEVEEPGPSIEQKVAFQQQVEHVQQVIGELPELTQQIFRLNRIEGLTHAEVARHLNISDSSVQKHLSRALAHVMRHMDKSLELP